MSAFLCTDEHFKQLAAWFCNDDRSSLEFYARRFGYQYSGILQPDGLASFLATLLLRENERSLSACYGDDPTDRELTVTLGEVDRMAGCDLAAIAKAIDCYEYQACESEGYDQTDAAAVCAYMRKEIGRRLPGYESAEWGQPCEFQEPARNIISLSSMIG